MKKVFFNKEIQVFSIKLIYTNPTYEPYKEILRTLQRSEKGEICSI